jgi:hypothetical protein
MALGGNVVSVILDAKNLSNPAFKAMNGNLAQMASLARTALPLVTAAAGAAAAGFALMSKEALNNADELNKLGQKAGASTEFLSSLVKSGDLAGVTFEGLEKSTKKLNEAIVKNSPAFSEMGIATRTAAGEVRKIEQILPEVADRFADMADGAKKAELAAQLFGERAGQDMIPLLNQGSKALKEQQDEFRRWGLIVTKEGAAASEQFNDNLAKLKMQAEGLANVFVMKTAPALAQLSEALLKLSDTGAGPAIGAGLANVVKMEATKAVMAVAPTLALLNAIKSKFGGGDATDAFTKQMKDARALIENMWNPPAAQEKQTNTIQGPSLEGDFEQAPEKNLESYKLEQEMVLNTLYGVKELEHAEKMRYEARILQIGELNVSEEASIQLLTYANLEHYEKMSRAMEEFHSRQADLENQAVAKKKLSMQMQLQAVAKASGDMAAVAAAFGAKGFKAWKVFAIAEATVNAYLSATGVFAALAKTNPFLAVVASGAALAAGLANVAKIAATEPMGAAHGGMTSIPEESTWLLNKGERVLSPRQNEDFTSFMEGNGGERTGPTEISVYLDGDVLAHGVGELSRDGRLEIHAKAIR